MPLLVPRQPVGEGSGAGIACEVGWDRLFGLVGREVPGSRYPCEGGHRHIQIQGKPQPEPQPEPQPPTTATPPITQYTGTAAVTPQPCNVPAGRADSGDIPELHRGEARTKREEG